MELFNRKKKKSYSKRSLNGAILWLGKKEKEIPASVAIIKERLVLTLTRVCACSNYKRAAHPRESFLYLVFCVISAKGATLENKPCTSWRQESPSCTDSRQLEMWYTIDTILWYTIEQNENEFS